MATRLIAILVLALSLLPVANLIPGGARDVEYMLRLIDWANGLALCVGVGGLAMYVSTVLARRTRVTETPVSSASDDFGNPGECCASTFLWGLGVAAFGLYVLVAREVFSSRPLLIDEIVQVLQARWYAAGHLSVPTAPAREFFSILHLVDVGDRTFGQFPAGGPAMLALGSLIGAEWLIGPLVGAGSVVLFAKLLEHLEPAAPVSWRRLAAALFAVAPFGAFMFGSHMNHATTLFWLLAAVVALARLSRDEKTPPSWGLLVGLSLGMATSIRPVDGAAFALPAAVWLLWRARRGRRPLLALLWSGIGIAIPTLVLLWVNSRTTGQALLFGYDLLWGASHGLGFHRSPWGPVHTPARGLELVSLYFTRLSVYLFETPFPALLPAAVALWYARALGALDRYLLASSGFVVLGYWAYWHDGFYLGPRFMVPLLPMLVVWSARLPLAIRARWRPTRTVWVGVRAALWAGTAYALFSIAVVRIPQYRNGMTSMRLDVAHEAGLAGIRQALVLVKESWGAQLVVRLWARGISRSDAEMLYRNADACKLELELTALERAGTYGPEARTRLRALQADSAALVRSARSPDYTERLLPGYVYAPLCEARLQQDQGGFFHLAPARVAQDDNIYARWLPGREAEIAAYFPERPVFLLRRAGTELESPVVFEALRR